jgi:hypothetical protein
VNILLKKLIKNDFKSQYWFFAILFAAAVVLPIILYALTPNAETEEIPYAMRILAQNLGPAGVVIISLIFSAIMLGESFSGSGAYLMFSIPAKTRSHIASKAIIFYFFFVLTVVFAVLAGCLVDMDFQPLSREINTIGDRFQTLAAVSGGIAVPGQSVIYTFITIITETLSYLAAPLVLYAFILATISFGQLWVNHKKAGRIVFVVGAVALLTVYAIFHGLVEQYYFSRVWMFPEGFTIHTLYSIRDIIDIVIMFVVILALLRFSNFVYTKKINVF